MGLSPCFSNWLRTGSTSTVSFGRTLPEAEHGSVADVTCVRIYRSWVLFETTATGAPEFARIMRRV